jgi:hypothetical protein
VRVATGWGTVVGNPTYTEAAATIYPGNYYSLTMADNAARLTLSGPVAVENSLNLNGGLINTTSTNLLTLYENATVTGGSNTSFVNGPVARALGIIGMNTDFLLPVGKASAYRPITLRLTQTAPNTFTAEQMEGNPGGTLAGPNIFTPTPLQRVSSVRWFTLLASNTNNNTISGKVTLSFGPDDGVNDPTDPGLVVASRSSVSSNQWLNMSNTGFTGTPNMGPFVSGTVSSRFFNVLTPVADFALGATNSNTSVNPLAANPLPVELTAFSAKRETTGVALNWRTASEKNSARFEVQRSLNGETFATVATVAAAGTSSQPRAYAALDRTAPYAQLYYRLRQVDNDGTFAYSPVVALAAGQGEVVLYPNPARETLTFTTAATTSYRVLNQLGQSLLSGTTEAGAPTLNVSKLVPGVYLLELTTGTGRVVRKFVKE